MPETASEKELLQEASEAEDQERFDEAARIYEQIIRRHSLQTLAYDRLMIIYRKSKKYKDELRVVDKGIKAFEDYFKKKADKMAKKHKQLVKLSNALMKSTGLADKSHEYFPEPLNRWRNRREIIRKKLKLK